MEANLIFIILLFLKNTNFSNSDCVEFDTIKSERIAKQIADYDEELDDYDYENLLITHRNSEKQLNKSIMLLCESISSIENVENSKPYNQLKFIDSNLTILKSMAFKKFETVTKLYLSHNKIKEIQPTSFDGLTKLEELHLSHNQLQEVQKGVFNSLHFLKILTLNDNQIHNIEKNSFIGCSELIELFLQRNQIESFEDLEFTSLKLLDLAQNPLKHFDINTNLSLTLNLSFTMIEELNMSQFEATKLELVNSKLKKISFLSKGEKMDFSLNKITDLQFTTVNVSNISFSSNLISSISGRFDSVYFNVSDNQLTILKNLFFGNRIESLDFSLNRISELQITSVQNSSLKFLYLQHNNLSKVSPSIFTNFSRLKILNLGYNQIEEFQFGTFDNLAELKTLDLSGNKLKSLNEKMFHSILALNNLYFDSNQISHLNFFHLRYYYLNNISLDNNNWSCVELVYIKSFCRNQHINLIKGSSYDGDNVNGIACKNEKQVNITTKISPVTKSPLIQFFEDGFKNSSFMKFFNDSNFGNSENKDEEVQPLPVNMEPVDHSSDLLLLGIFITQIFIVISLVGGCFFVVQFLRNYKNGRHHMQLSQIEIL